MTAGPWRTAPAAPGPPVALTIAGSDSGGGAGIQADLKTFAAHGVYGLCAVTAVTAQNTREVRAVAAVPPAVVAAQIDAVLEDFGAGAVKIGMLWSAATVRVVAERLREWRGRMALPVVLDPVLAAGSGAPLLLPAGPAEPLGAADRRAPAAGGAAAGAAAGARGVKPPGRPPSEDAANGGGEMSAGAPALAVLLTELLPLATLVTPNLPELERLAALAAEPERQAPDKAAGPHAGGMDGAPGAAGMPGGEPERLLLARRLAAWGPAVLAKGGHDPATGGEVVDWLLIPAGHPASGGAERIVRFAGCRLVTRAGHGTGCTLSAAIAARLAAGYDLAAAAGAAIEYVRQAMQAAPPLGGGPGPLAHFHGLIAQAMTDPRS
jgi:hydroxymethylpyrimidine/phosphomethylpyrimidine kinase